MHFEYYNPCFLNLICYLDLSNVFMSNQNLMEPLKGTKRLRSDAKMASIVPLRSNIEYYSLLRNLLLTYR